MKEELDVTFQPSGLEGKNPDQRTNPSTFFTEELILFLSSTVTTDPSFLRSSINPHFTKQPRWKPSSISHAIAATPPTPRPWSTWSQRLPIDAATVCAERFYSTIICHTRRASSPLHHLLWFRVHGFPLLCIHCDVCWWMILLKRGFLQINCTRCRCMR
jgi:hypothetical protein